MAEGNEYYGSEKARSAYENLHAAYETAGWINEEIDAVLRLEIPDNAFFNEQGIYNNHGGANVVFDNPDNLNWVISHSKGCAYETDSETKNHRGRRHDGFHAAVNGLRPCGRGGA